MRATAKIWGARASEHSFKFCEQLKILMDYSSPLTIEERSAFAPGSALRKFHVTDSQDNDRRSKRAWSKCVLCIPFILSRSPNECWLHTCDSCVITSWRLGLPAPLVARKKRLKYLEVMLLRAKIWRFWQCDSTTKNTVRVCMCRSIFGFLSKLS